MACVGCVLCEHLAVRHYDGHTEQTELSLHLSFNPSLHTDVFNVIKSLILTQTAFILSKLQ